MMRVHILAKLIDENRKRPFEWGEFDCCIFGAMCVDAMTDSNLEQEIRSKYSNKLEALKLIDEAGGLEALVAPYLGEEVKPNYEREGDIVMLENEVGPAIGVLHKGQVISTGEHGLVAFKRSVILKAWRV